MFGFYLTAGRAFKMIKTGERNNRGIPCCMGILWLLGILLPDREFTDISLHCY